MDEPDFAALQHAVLSGHAAQRPLPDLTLLPLFIVLRSLTYLAWAATPAGGPGFAGRLGRYLTLANQLINRYLV